jgi:hypothetical protein
MMRSRRMRWAGHITQMGRREMHISYWWDSQKDDKYVGEWIILKFTLER